MAEDTVTPVESTDVKDNKPTLKGLASQVSELTAAVSALLQSQREAKVVGVPVGIPPSAPAGGVVTPKVEGGPEFEMVPPDWVRIKNEVLGEDFGLIVNWPGDNNNNGILLKVVVPPAKSNMPQMQREMMKADIRTKPPSNNPSSEEIRKFFEKVKANLVRTQVTQLAK